MADHILLAWSRRHELDGDEHLHDGYISVESKGRVILKEDFKGLHYHQLITRLSAKARARPDAELFMLRLEQKQPMALGLDKDTADLIRKDPVSYIRATSLPAQRVVLRRNSKVGVSDEVTIKPLPIRAGSDALAEAFGDHVYLRVRPHPQVGLQVECPGCGRWVGFAMRASTQQFLVKCDKGCSKPTSSATWVAIEELAPASKDENPRWAKVSTELLLAHAYERYYLPREWNTSGPWISHADLVKKYEHYIKEKETCLDNLKDTVPSA